MMIDPDFSLSYKFIKVCSRHTQSCSEVIHQCCINYKMQYRLVSEFAYSRRDNSESYEQILSQRNAKRGLGFSRTIGIEPFPKNAMVLHIFYITHGMSSVNLV